MTRWSALALLAALGCGSSPGGSGPHETAAPSSEPVGTSTDAPEPAPGGQPGWAPELEPSAGVRRCLELVESQAFADAVETCTQALAEGPSPEAERALAEARAILGDDPAPAP